MARKQKKEPKTSPAKQKIIDNYEQQQKNYLEKGYAAKQETISIVKANVMAFVTAGPFVILGVLVWMLTGRGGEWTYTLWDCVLFLVLMFASIFIHEGLHSAGWVVWTKEKWKSICFGMIWEALTPYCHCKEPLRPAQYLWGGLMPFLVLGIGGYILAWATGNLLLWFLSLFNMLAAGGDTTIVCMLIKYLGKKDCYILDHPTDCGFVAFIKADSIERTKQKEHAEEGSQEI